MRLATFADPAPGEQVRFGIVRGESMIDVVAAAQEATFVSERRALRTTRTLSGAREDRMTAEYQ